MFGSLFSHRVAVGHNGDAPVVQGGPKVAADQPGQNQGGQTGTVSSLVSGDSLATFGGGTVGITVVWGGIERMFGLPHYIWLGAAIAFLFGALLLWNDLADPDRAPKPRVPMRILAALVNTFILFNAASGALSTVGPPGPPGASPAVTAPAPAH